MELGTFSVSLAGPDRVLGDPLLLQRAANILDGHLVGFNPYGIWRTGPAGVVQRAEHGIQCAIHQRLVEILEGPRTLCAEPTGDLDRAVARVASLLPPA